MTAGCSSREDLMASVPSRRQSCTNRRIITTMWVVGTNIQEHPPRRQVLYQIYLSQDGGHSDGVCLESARVLVRSVPRAPFSIIFQVLAVLPCISAAVPASEG